MTHQSTAARCRATVFVVEVHDLDGNHLCFGMGSKTAAEGVGVGASEGAG